MPRLPFSLKLITGLLLIGILVHVVYGFSNPIDQTPVQGIILGFTSDVEVKRADELRSAELGMELYQGDIVITYQAGTATLLLYCEGGLVVQLAAQQNIAIDCEQTATLPIIHHFKPGTLSQPPSLPNLTGKTVETRRSYRPDIRKQLRSGLLDHVVTLLYPRNTVITDTRPTFVWEAMEGFNPDYRLTVNIIGGDRYIIGGDKWTRLTNTNQLPYPADVSPLAPGDVAVVSIDLGTATKERNKTFLRVLDRAGLVELAEAETAIQNLGLSEPAYGYLLAQLYHHYELRAAAISQLEILAKVEDNTSPYLQQALGHLYFASGLYEPAEAAYRAALQTAQGKTDATAQAAAYWGLAGIARVFGEIQMALDYCTRAETLSRHTGTPAQAEQITQRCQPLRNWWAIR